MKSKLRLISLLVLMIMLCQLLPVSAEQQTGPQVWIESSYINVFKDDQKSDDDLLSMQLVMAKNEFESAQICIRAPEDFTIEQVIFTDLKSDSNTIIKENLKYNYVEYFYLPNNTASLNKISAVRFGSDYYPDALSNETEIEVEKDTTQPIWVTVYVPKDSHAGTYEGEALLKTTLGDFTVDLSVEVNDVIIPDSDESNYETLMWQLIIGSGFGRSTANYHPEDPIVKNYKYERWTEQWWDLVDDIAQQMKDHRLNVLFVQTVQLLVDGGTTLDEDGTYIFNWSKFDEYIEFFMDKGVVKSLAGYMMTSAGSNVNYIRRDYTGESVTGSTRMSSKDADNWFTQYIPALYEHLIEKGWLDIWLQNLRDEPSGQDDQADYAKLMEYIKTYAPDMKVGDPHTTRGSGTFLISQEVDVLIPLINLYGSNLSIYRKALTGDKKLWSYTCVVPGGSHLNRFIDKPVWQGRSIAYFNYTTGATGYLHWGLMGWYRAITDFANGDTSSIFPDAKNNKVKSSIRLAALRDGSEDYELLKLLENNDFEMAMALSERVAKSSNSYNKEPDEMVRIRNMLVRAAAGVPDAIPPMKSITLNTYDLTIAVGDVYRIEYEIAPEDAFFPEVAIENDNKEVLELFTTGHVKALSTGEAKVIISSKMYPDIKAICNVTVVELIEEETTAETTAPSTSNENNTDENPNNNAILYIGIVGIAFLAIAAVLFLRKKK